MLIPITNQCNIPSKKLTYIMYLFPIILILQQIPRHKRICHLVVVDLCRKQKKLNSRVEENKQLKLSA